MIILKHMCGRLQVILNMNCLSLLASSANRVFLVHCKNTKCPAISFLTKKTHFDICYLRAVHKLHHTNIGERGFTSV